MATRERSPNYPAHGLPESIDHVRKLYEVEKRASVPYESAARALGYTSLSGRARVKISTLRKFGLVEESKGRVRVSDLALRVLFPTSLEDRQAAIDDAASRPDVFRELLSNDGASEQTMVNDLVHRGYSPDGARATVASFRETMKVVSSSPLGLDEPDSEDELMIDAPPVATSGSAGPGMMRQHARPQHTTADYAWLLPKGVRVELRFEGGELTKDGLRLLRKYLAVLEEAIDESIDPSNEPERPSAQSRTDAPD